MNMVEKSCFIEDRPILIASNRLDNLPSKPSICEYKKITEIVPDEKRVITRFFKLKNENQIRHIIERILKLSEEEVNITLNKVIEEFSYRHKNIKEVFLKHFNYIIEYIPHPEIFSEERKLLTGAYFTMEYSIESTALFNPSIVIYPKQNDLKEGETRVIVSLRAVGEGHISSIVFRSIIIDKDNNIYLEPVSKYVTCPNIVLNPVYIKSLYIRKLKEIGVCNEVTKRIFSKLKEEFTFEDLKLAIKELKEKNKLGILPQEVDATIDKIIWLAQCNYEVEFPPDCLITERVLFPVSPSETNGLEDARFVLFVDDDGSKTYYATYTAYNGKDILPQLIETKDFHHFKMITLNGPVVQNKGMALFPRKINSKYAMISRIDGENLYIMYSDNVHFWYEAKKIKEPEKTWELVQIGNCGSPIETEQGWLLLTHGVGPVRKYCIGALLLDLKDPSEVIGVLEEPLISPTQEEREGYVPNVVYSCGALLLNGELIIPYATSDRTSHFGIIKLEELFKRMKYL